MKHLNLALLISLAPLALNAESINKGCCDDRLVASQNDERFEEVCELAVFDIYAAYEANTAYVTVSGSSLSADAWQFIATTLSNVFGRQPDLQSSTELSYLFPRANLSTMVWFELLAEIELQFVSIQSTIQGQASCANAFIEIGLNR
jgi:hypothetical protein